MPNSKHEAREQRILDTAAGLFVHYGYDKTTVADIARDSGISKGAVYLHFESKDALFEALLRREMLAHNHAWLARVDADPEGGTIGALFKHSLYALEASPFMAALFMQDDRVLGSYLRKPGGLFTHRKPTRHLFVEQMQRVGAIRAELDPKVHGHILDMLAFSLVAIGQIRAVEDMPPSEPLIEAIGDMLQRALAPEDGGDSDAGKAIVQALSAAARAKSSETDHPGEESHS